ncbi:MAG: hypothetical protein P8N76_05950 [Pirellulaceae bacterium]|nr:hypothetical protein [Pirellulaceae bacterium]
MTKLNGSTNLVVSRKMTELTDIPGGIPWNLLRDGSRMTFLVLREAAKPHR